MPEPQPHNSILTFWDESDHGTALAKARSAADYLDIPALTQILSRELRAEVTTPGGNIERLASRIATEVDRIARKVDGFKPLDACDRGNFRWLAPFTEVLKLLSARL